MRKRPKVTAVFLAKDEERFLPYSLKCANLLKDKGLIHDIVVVDDGSKDRTAEVAKEHGAHVVPHKKNLGKSNGFITGLHKTRDLGGDVMLTLDSDVVRLPEESVKKMVAAVTEGGHDIAVAQQYEVSPSDLLSDGRLDPDKEDSCRVERQDFCGFRAFNVESMKPVLEGRRRHMEALLLREGDIPPEDPDALKRHMESHSSARMDPREIEARRKEKPDCPWAMETALDALFPNHVWLSRKAGNPEAHIYAMKPYRHDSGMGETEEDQYAASNKVREYFLARKRAARHLLQERVKRSGRPK